MGCDRKINPKLILRPGDLRHRVTVQSRGRTPDGAGGYTPTRATLGKFWASIEPMRGEEFLMESGAVTTIQKIKVRMRYVAGLTTSHRIVRADGVVMNIREVLDIELRHAVHELICDEGGGEA